MEVNKEDLLKFTRDYREMQTTYKILIDELRKSLTLLDKSVNFMNQVPDNEYGENYKICSEISKFLDNLHKNIKDL
jgi:hypothetical protein